MERKDMASLDAICVKGGNPPQILFASIDHRIMDGGHLFTSDQIPGLMVGHRDIKVAINQLPHVIEELVKHNLKMECKVFLGNSLEDFLKDIKNPTPHQVVLVTTQARAA